ncbi:MAG TPA: DUF6531 domain-containing protein [Dehalococcoidia bacterium]|nr:DUF6531 domain-containing protein [Dehalococcoidia bacterium]
MAGNLFEHWIPSNDWGDPVDTSTGQFTHQHTDMLIPGKGVPLEFSRSYGSMSSQNKDLGFGWTHNYAIGLKIYSDSSVTVRYPSGNTAFFKYNAGTFTPPTGVFDTLVKNGDGTYTLTTVSAVKYNFSTTGKLMSIVDRNNNATTLAYTGDVMTSVTDPGGRSRKFGYDSARRITQILDPSLGAPASVSKVGTFAKSITTGNQTVFHNLGATPKALILWTIAADDERYRTHFGQGLGMTDGTTSRALSAASRDNQNVTDASRGQSSTTAVLVLWGEVNTVNGTFVSWDQDFFTINWTINSPVPTNIGYLIIGGSSVQARVVGWDTPTTAGNIAVTGVGFQPDAVLHAYNGLGTTALPTVAPHAGFGLGAMDKFGSQWANFTLSDDNVGTSNSNRGQRTDSALYTFTGAGATDLRSSFVSMDTDGFTMNFVNASATSNHVPSLALKGPGFKVGNFSKSTGTAPATQSVAGVGFKPGGLLLSSIQTSATNFASHARLGIGATDGKSQFSTAYDDTDNLGTSGVNSIQKVGRTFLKMDNNTPLIEAEARFASFDADGFTLDWTTNDAVSSQMLYLALPPNPAGLVEFTYDGAGDLVKVLDAKGGVTKYTYSGHRMTSLTDSNGHLTNENIHDTANRVVEQTDANGGKSCLYYGAGPAYTSTACPGVTPAAVAGQTITVDPRGKKTTFDFDTKFRTSSVADHDGFVTSYAYDANNNRSCVTDPLAHKTGYTYDTKGNVTSVIDANNTDANCALAGGGVKWTYTYTAKNDIDLETDPLGRQTDYIYDTNGNLTEVQRKDGGGNIKLRTCYTVNSAGLVTEQIESTTLSNCTGNVTKLEYDTYGNQTAVIDPRFSGAGTPKTTMTYDTTGRRLTVTNELNHTDTFTYDAQNNVLTSKDNLNNTTTNTYDAKGNLKTVTDANSKLTTYNYDNGDRLISVVDANNKTTTYSYDANGNRTAVVNANRQVVSIAESGAQCGGGGTGNGVDDDSDSVIDDGCPSVLYTYDNLNRLASQKDALGNTWTYAYDGAGRRTSRTDAKSQQTTYAYNNRNDLTSITYPGPSTVTYTYDNARNRTQMVDSTGTTTYTPDALNRLTSVTFPGSRTVGYGYNNVGNRTSITYPGGSNQVTYGYDVANNLTSVTDWNSQQTTYAYDNAGNLTTVTLPSGTGVVGSYGYDTADRLTSVSWSKGGVIAAAAYTLDNVGNRTQRLDGLGTHTYAYDNLYRLTSVTYPGPSTDTYTYDAAGNRLTKGATSYTYDAADRMTVAGGVSYGYDNNGNQTSRGSDTYAWDAEDRMTAATVGGTTTTFAYNGDGLRNSRTVGGNTTTFTWDVVPSVPQVLDDGAFKYVYGLERIGEVGPGATTHYYLPDGLGSTMALVDASGTVVKTYNYDVFGAVRSQTGSQANEFQFTGEQVDTSTGLQFLRARYYDSNSGRFIARDPLWKDPFWTEHPFAYASANPVNHTDPSGLDDEERANQCRRDYDKCIDMGIEWGVRLRRVGTICGELVRRCLLQPLENNGLFDFKLAGQRFRASRGKPPHERILDFLVTPILSACR